MEKKEELLPMNEMQNADENDVNEKSPLKAETETNADGKQNGKEKGDDAKPNRAKPVALNLRTRLVIAIVLVTLLMLAIIMTAIGFGISSKDEEETTVHVESYLKLIPTPNEKKQTIAFTSGHKNEGEIWPELVDEINAFLGKYNSTVVDREGSNVTVCNDKDTEAPENKACLWDITEITKICNASNNFGYADGSPCVFIVMDETRNFTAESYTEEDLKDPELVSANLTEYRAGETFVYIDCQPNTIIDKESAPTIKYAPSSQQFPKKFLSNTRYPDYGPPFIAVKFENPRKQMYFGITCRMYAKNITLAEGFASPDLPFQMLIK